MALVLIRRFALLIPAVVLAAVFCVFFYKVLLFHQAPFPGDLLVNTSPFKTESYAGYGPAGYPNKAQGRDVIAQLYPWNVLEAEAFKKGQIPFWNPYNFSGNILMQNYQTGVFYPLDSLLLFASFQNDWTLFILLQPLLALFFMYLFLRELQLGKAPSMIGAIAFAFSSYMTVWLEWGNIDHTLLWLPLILFCITRLFRRVQVKWFLLLIAGLFSCMLAGYIQGAFYVVVVAVLYAQYLFLRKQGEKVTKAIWATAVAFLSAVCIAAINIVPTLSFLSSSTRGAYSLPQIQNLLNPWYYLVTLFAPDFFGNPATRNFFLPITYFERVMYVGVPILFFALFALRKIKAHKDILFFFVLGIGVLLLSLNLPGIAFIYKIPIPVLSTTVPTRILGIFLFCMVVLGAYGIQLWMKEKKSLSKFPLVFLLLYGILWVVVLLLPKFHPSFSNNLLVSRHNLILPTLLAFATVVAFYLKNKWGRVSIGILFVLVVVDMFYGFQKFTPFAPPSLVYPETPVIQFLQTHGGIYRSWGYGNAYIPANYHSYYHIYSADGYDSLFVKEYATLLNSSADGTIHLPLSRTDANIAPGFGPTDFKRNSYRQMLLNLLGVRYVINLNESLTGNFTPDYDVFPKETYTLVWQHGPWQVYENKKVVSRFFLTPDYIVQTGDSALKTLYTMDTQKTLILAKAPQYPTDKTAKGSVRLVSYQPNMVRLATTTTGPQLLFLSDTYYKDWKAAIDGKDVPIIRADYAFRAVEIPKGVHSVTFFYAPTSFTLGLLIAGVGCCIGIVAALLLRIT